MIKYYRPASAILQFCNSAIIKKSKIKVCIVQMSVFIPQFCSSQRKKNLKKGMQSQTVCLVSCQKNSSLWWCAPQNRVTLIPRQLWSNCHFFVGEIFSGQNPLIRKINWSFPKLNFFHLSLQNYWVFVQKLIGAEHTN